MRVRHGLGWGLGWVLVSLGCAEGVPGPVDGSLTVTAPTSLLGAVGDFVLAWRSDTEQLEVRHASSGDRLVFATVPGRAFVAAAAAEWEISEARGLFDLEERFRTVCAEQTWSGIVATEAGLVLSGSLRCEGGGAAGWILEVSEPTPGHLALALDVAGRADLNRSFLIGSSRADEHFFGFGEQFTFFDAKGKRLPILVSEQGIGRGEQPITVAADAVAGAGGDWYHSYAPVPHFVTTDLRSFFLENDEPSVFDLRDPERVVVEVLSTSLRGRAVAGPDAPGLVEAYTRWSGRMRPLPEWLSAGAVVGVQGGTEKVREVWAQLDEAGVPLAAFWLQDWCGQRTTSFGKQLWWNWELDTDHYPGWEELVADLAAAGIRVLVYVNPFLVDADAKGNARRNLFAEARDAGHLVLDGAGEPYLIPNTDFSAGILDLTSPDARAWMQTVLEEEVLPTGASGWMADFGESLPLDGRFFDAESDPLALHNAYPVEWATLNREVVDRTPGGEDLVFFMRSGYSRSPGQSTLFWLGDQMVTWDHHDGLKTAVTGLLSSGLSGFAFNHSDIGGYTAFASPVLSYFRSAELLQRWTELAAFTPVFRTHEGNRPDDNHQIYSDPASLEHFARFARVYEAWGFYRAELIREAAATGLPVVRHPWLLYPDDPVAAGLNEQQLFVGTEILVAPVLDPGVSMMGVRLPAGSWTHVWTGERFDVGREGLTVGVSAPLGEPPVFVRPDGEVGRRFLENLAAAGLLDD